MKTSGGDMKTSGGDMKTSGGDMKTSGGDMKTSGEGRKTGGGMKTPGKKKETPTLQRADGSLMDFTGLSYTTIYKLEIAGKFPKRRRMSENRVCWLRDEVAAWMENLPTAA